MAVESMDESPQALVERALSSATLPSMVIVRETTQANLRWASNSLSTNGQMRTRELTVIATAPVEGGIAVGSVSQELSSADQVADQVSAAEAMARSGPPAEDASDLVEDYAHGDDWAAAPATTSIEVFGELAPALGQAFSAAAAAGHLLFGFAEHIVTTSYLGTSTGLRRRGVQPTGRLELNAKSSDFTDSAWVGTSTRDFRDVDITSRYTEVVTRLGWSSRRVDLEPGRYETLMPPGAIADLMIYAYWTATARKAEEGRTVFGAGDGQTKIGQQLSNLPITLRSQPDATGIECTPFVLTSASGELASVFDNGSPLAPTDWIRDGRLTQLIRHRAWARKTGQPPVGSIDNLIMEADGTATLEEMISRTERGLLLTCLWYIREVDPERLLLTGLTRDGVYLIENGQITAAVNNFRFNESPVDLLSRIAEVGAAEQTLCREWNDYFTRTIMPPVRIRDFNMSTVSQAS